MNGHKIMGIAALSVPLFPVAAQADSKPQKQQDNERPNIVVVIADDLLSTELGCYGGQNIKTPNIDRIAREGIQFNDIYASEAISVPIRASMYTGLYPAKHGSYQNHKDTFFGTKTVNEYMPEEGYRVGRAGKNHPITKSVYKFDEIPGFTVNCTARKAPYTTDGIKAWISKSDQPFLLYVCSINPHAPWTWGDPSEFNPSKLVLPDNCVDSPEMRDIFCHYLAEVRALDNEVGSVYQVLQETGKLDNTILIFLGEQGPQFPGGKWTLWYPGVHSSLLARYPAKIKAGSKSEAIVQYEDLLPTFLDIAGGKPRPELDGKSFKDALFGRTDKARQYAYGIHNNLPEGTPYPIRSIRDDRYALIMNLTPEVPYYEKHLMNIENSPTGVWKSWLDAAKTDKGAEQLCKRFVNRPDIEFYDVKKDPWELNDLAGKPEYQKRIETMKAELLKWMAEQNDPGAVLDVPYSNEPEVTKALSGHDKAVLVKGGWIRDPYIVLAPDGYYYLTGTTPDKGDPREKADTYNTGNGQTPINTGLGEKSIVGSKMRLWRSPNLVNWEYVGAPYDITYTKSLTQNKQNVLWAPELHWANGHWLLVHCPQAYSTLAISAGPDIKGPWTYPNPDVFRGRHDPSLFQDTDGTWYMTYQNRFLVQIKPDFSGVTGDPVDISPKDRVIGHEGTTIKKIGGKYVFFGTAWSTDQPRKGSYNLYYCTADKVTGPYSNRRFVGRFLGHGTPFQDKEGNWWCTAFYNANVPPVDSTGIETKDLSANAQTINVLGTTLVPLKVEITPDGDVYIRAIDPAYATPGPDEKQKFD